MQNAECRMQKESRIRPFSILHSAFCILHCRGGCLLLPGVLLLALVGCESGFGSRQQPDPMLGIHAPPTPVAPPGGPSNTPAQTAMTDQTPPLPASYTAVGPAAVAAGETATPEPGRDLRIAGDALTPASLSGNGAVRGVAPGVTVGNPEPATNGATSHLAPVPVSGGSAQSGGVSTPLASGGGDMTFDQAQRLLSQYGVTWQRLDKFDGQWKFECGVPNPQNPAVNRHFVTTRSFPDPVSAMREVIAQIEKKGVK
jgi:hypothetical protein